MSCPKQKIHHKEFKDIFKISGHSNSYMAWKKIAAILELKDILSHIEGIKTEVEEAIKDMEWIDVKELVNIHMKKKKQTSGSKKEPDEDWNERMKRMESIVLKFMDSQEKTAEIKRRKDSSLGHKNQMAAARKNPFGKKEP